jgi:hypothetical protein
MDLRDVEAGRTVEQIREQSEVQAWKNDGGQVAAAVISTGGYRDEVGTYRPIVGIYDSESTTPVLIDSSVLSKPLTVTVSDTYVRTRVTFDANGGTLVGPRVITVIEPEVSLPYLPASPVRDGYTFRYWATAPSDGTQFTYDTPLAGDVTVYAIWDAIPTTPTPPTPPPTIVTTTPAPVIINNPPAEGGITYTTVEAGSGTEESTLAGAEPEEFPETTPPLASGGALSGWSLFDLLATILALVLLVVFFIRFFFDRPRDEEYEEEPVDVQLWEAMTPDQRAQYQTRREADYQAWQIDQQRKNNRQKALFVNAPVLLIVAAALVEALIVLFTTQDFALGMSIVDDYSVIFALVLFVQLLTPMVAAIIRNNRRDNQQRAANQTAIQGGNEVTV